MGLPSQISLTGGSAQKGPNLSWGGTLLGGVYGTICICRTINPLLGFEVHGIKIVQFAHMRAVRRLLLFSSRSRLQQPRGGKTSLCMGNSRLNPVYSELAGPQDININDQVISHYTRLLRRQRHADVALEMPSQSCQNQLTYEEVQMFSDAFAEGLISQGMRPADLVVAFLPMRSEMFLLQLAVSKVGAILALLPERWVTADKIRLALNQFQPRFLVACETYSISENKGKETTYRSISFRDILYEVLPELGYSYPGQTMQWIQSREFPYLQQCIFIDTLNDAKTIPSASNSTTPLPLWGPFSYREHRLRRHSLLSHPDDPILILNDPNPALEDKVCVVYTHRNCMNSGQCFSSIVNLTHGKRFTIFPSRETDHIGPILAHFASLCSGATLVYSDTHLPSNAEQWKRWMESLKEKRINGVLMRLCDLNILKTYVEKLDTGERNVDWVAIMESASEPYTDVQTLSNAKVAFGASEIYVFRGTTESCGLLSWRSLARSCSLVSHAQIKVVGDRGTVDAKILVRNTRGNLRLRGPHITSFFYNHAGLMTELVDERGWVFTSREGTVSTDGNFTTTTTQIY